MKRKIRAGLLALVLTPTLASAAVDVTLDGSRLTISEGAFEPSDLARLEQLFGKHGDEITVVEFRNVIGGVASTQHRLQGRLYGKEVRVTGLCASACALLALSGRRIVFEQGDSPVRPMLMIHGAFDLNNGQWSPHGLQRLEWLASRLDSHIPRERIREALSFKTPAYAGLFLYPAEAGSGLVVSKLCDPAPENCKTLWFHASGENRIHLSTQQAPLPRRP